MSDANWTPQRVEMLRQLWDEGLSASQVARVLGGVTRNAVIGKVHRLGLNLRGGPGGARKTYATARSPRFSVAAEPEPTPTNEPEPIMLPNGDRYSIVTIHDGLCRWPFGDPKAHDFHFCGHGTIPPSPYCLAHARKARTAGNPRPKRDEAGEELAAIARAERVFG